MKTTLKQLCATIADLMEDNGKVRVGTVVSPVSLSSGGMFSQQVLAKQAEKGEISSHCLREIAHQLLECPENLLAECDC